MTTTVRICGCGCGQPLPAGSNPRKQYVDEKHRKHAENVRYETRKSSDPTRHGKITHKHAPPFEWERIYWPTHPLAKRKTGTVYRIRGVVFELFPDGGACQVPGCGQIVEWQFPGALIVVHPAMVIPVDFESFANPDPKVWTLGCFTHQRALLRIWQEVAA